MDEAPLILTVMLDDASQDFFQSARQRWFPAELNYIRAHVTLFHHLPGERLACIKDYLVEACAGQVRSPVSVTGVRSLGHGVAYTLVAPEIEVLRSRLAEHWRETLTAQDRQAWRPHVTVQNKVPAQAARDLMALLSRSFKPFTAQATGLAIWRYRGGPWDGAAVIPFAS